MALPPIASQHTFQQVLAVLQRAYTYLHTIDVGFQRSVHVILLTVNLNNELRSHEAVARLGADAGLQRVLSVGIAHREARQLATGIVVPDMLQANAQILLEGRSIVAYCFDDDDV